MTEWLPSDKFMIIVLSYIVSIYYQWSSACVVHTHIAADYGIAEHQW